MNTMMKRRLDLLEKATASMTLFDRTRVPLDKELEGQPPMVQLCDWLSKREQDHVYGLEAKP